MRTLYHAHGKAQYDCNHRELTGLAPRCPGLAARAVDDLIAQQVLRALEPAAIELSIQAQSDVEKERQRLEKHWQQRRQRARYDNPSHNQRLQVTTSTRREWRIQGENIESDHA